MRTAEARAARRNHNTRMGDHAMTTTEPITDPADDPAIDPAADPAAQPQRTDWKAKYESTLAESRKHEQRSKDNAAAARELAELKKSSMTDLERATEAARTEARTEVMREANSKLVAAEIRAAAAGRSIDPAALLDIVDPARFITEAGDVDTAAIVKALDRLAPAADPNAPQPRRPVDFGGGARGQGVTPDPAQVFGDFLQGQLRR